MNQLKSFMTPCAELTLLEDGFLFAKFNPILTNVEDVHLHTQLCNEFLNGKKALFLSDIRGLKSATKDVRSAFASAETAKVCEATAILIKLGVPRVVGNIFLMANKPHYPTKLFTNEQKAKKWLSSFK